MQKSKTSILVECGLMIAMATLLSYIKIFEMPMGGSVTLCAMAPLVMASFRHGVKWGVLTGAVHGLLQMLLGFKNVLYCATIPAMIGCILLDYVIAFTAMGLACLFTFGLKNRIARICLGTVITGLIRYACSFLSGILIWGAYAPDDMPVWRYSLEYNGSYMIPEIIITAIAMAIIAKVLGEKLLPAKSMV